MSARSARPVSGAPTARQGGYGGNSERKRVTVLFSDLTGYSTLCERLDPEDVREMMNLVFKEVVGIIIRYEGYIDRIIGDEVLAVFGIPRTHEDDPIRAIRAAVDIHDTVAGMTDRFHGRLEKPMAMHSGIATGLVVTGITDLVSGRQGVTGDPVDRASVLTNLADSGEILVGPCTMPSTSGFFFFEKCKRRAGRDGAGFIDAYRVLSTVKRPDKTRRVLGLRARLIGRSRQMEHLHAHLSMVDQGRGACVSIAGDAGTGKSRLISEFKKASAPCWVDWFQGNAYEYTQGVPYFPLIDLMGRAVDLRDDDSLDMIRRKLAAELNPHRESDQAILQIIEHLFTQPNDKARPITPETWKLKLKQALVKMIDSQSKSGLTVICIEDMHWADPSTVALFRNLLNEADLPVLFLISYRPGQLAFDHRQITNPYYRANAIQLDDLPPEKGEEMAKSLLQSDQVPARLLTFISDQLGGNPFFLEEVVNALVDTGLLTKRGATWELSGPIGETAFSSSITALIAARLDRLGGAAKRIVQEASVIGRRFSPAILKWIASDPDSVDHSLATLESLGLILRSDDPGGDHFLFKHAMVRDVAYNSLLKRDRRHLHEKIARVLESQDPDRIDARCETLAYHFSNGHSIQKAVDYLKQSGRKGMKKSAYVESHDYYERAYRLVLNGDRIAADSSRCLVELVLEWFFVFDMRGRYKDALVLLRRHETVARRHVPLQLKGMYLTCLGWAYQRREDLSTSRDCLLEALADGERIHSHQVVAYACACLIWTCTAQGRLDEALAFTAKAEAASRILESENPSWSFEMDQDLVRFVFTGTAIAQWFKGDCRQCRHLGDRLLVYGEKAGDVNSISEGHLSHGMGCFAAGDYHGAVEKCILALENAASTIFAVNALFIKAYAHLSLGEVIQAEKNLLEILSFCQTSGCEYVATSADALSSVVAVAKGNVAAGVKALDRHARQALANGKPYHAQTIHYMLGCIFLQISMREGDLSLGMVLKNLPFFVRCLPRSAKHAEHHFLTAIRITGQTNALGIKGQASLDLGRLYQSQKRHRLAASLIKESVALFELLGADGHLKRAQDALLALE